MSKKNTAAQPKENSDAPATTETPNVSTDASANLNQELTDQENIIETTETAKTPEEGIIKMTGTNCSVGGVEYFADSDGVVTVTEEHAQLLERDFGFKRI